MIKIPDAVCLLKEYEAFSKPFFHFNIADTFQATWTSREQSMSIIVSKVIKVWTTFWYLLKLSY